MTWNEIRDTLRPGDVIRRKRDENPGAKIRIMSCPESKDGDFEVLMITNYDDTIREHPHPMSWSYHDITDTALYTNITRYNYYANLLED